MGVCANSHQMNRISSAKIIDQINRIILVSQQHQLKLQRQLKSYEQILLGQFQKDVSQRIKITEKAMIQRSVYTLNKKNIYLLLEYEAKKVKEYKQLLDNQTNFENILPSINTLVYSSYFLNDQQLVTLRNLIIHKYSNYKNPVDKDISQQLIVYHRHHEEVNYKMEYNYIMELCQNKSIALETINKIGHNYRYGITSDLQYKK